MKKRQLQNREKSDHDLLLETRSEVKMHRWIMFAILAAILSGVRVFDPVLFRWP